MLRPHATRILACLIMGMGAFLRAEAQVSDSVRVLGSIDVVGTRETAPHEDALFRVDRYRLSVTTTGQSLRMLDLVPGLDIRQAGPSGAALASLRGLGTSSTRIELDGIRLMDPATGTFDLSILPASVLASARVSSAISGDDGTPASPGGTISLQSDAATPSGLMWGSGAFGTITGDLRGRNRTANSAVLMALSMSRSEGDFRYPHPVLAGHPEVRRLDSDRSSFAGFVSGHREWSAESPQSRRSHPVKLGLVFLGTRVDRGLPSLSNAVAQGARQEDVLMIGGLDLTAVLFGTPMGTAFSATHSEFRFHPEVGDSTEVRVAEIAWSLDARRPISRSWLVRFESTLRRSNVITDRDQLVSGTQFQLSVTRFRSWLDAGLLVTSEVQWIKSSAANQRPSSSSLQQAVPTFHATVRWSDQLRIRLATGGLYRLPTLNERFWRPGGNPGLRPEKGWQSEAVVTWQKAYRGRPMIARATIFYNRISNRIVWRPALAGNARHVWTPDNVAQVVGAGLELDLRWQATPHWWLAGAAARVDQRDRSNPYAASYGRRLRYTAPMSAMVEIEYRRPRWGGFVSVKGTGRRFTASDETRWLPASTVIDAGGTFRFRIGALPVLATGSLLNLTDRFRESSPWMPMPGREWRLAFSFTP